MLTQSAMIIGGITTLLQLYPVLGFGMALPNVMGVAFAYMPILTMIGQQYGIADIFGSQLVAGLLSILLGMLIGKIRRFFPPIVSGTVVISIGLSVYKTAINYIGGGSAAQAAGICPKFSAIMATIPQPVLGGATVTVFTAITMSGIQLLNEQPMNYRNKMIVGIALAIGVGMKAMKR